MQQCRWYGHSLSLYPSVLPEPGKGGPSPYISEDSVVVPVGTMQNLIKQGMKLELCFDDIGKDSSAEHRHRVPGAAWHWELCLTVTMFCLTETRRHFRHFQRKE